MWQWSEQDVSDEGTWTMVGESLGPVDKAWQLHVIKSVYTKSVKSVTEQKATLRKQEISMSSQDWRFTLFSFTAVNLHCSDGCM